MKKSSVLLLLASLLGSGCSSPSDPEVAPSGIVGSWKWVETRLAWHPGQPISADLDRVATYAADNTFRETVSGKLQRSGTYSVASKSDTVGQISYDGQSMLTAYWIRGDSLGIGNVQVDGDLEIFIRMR